MIKQNFMDVIAGEKLVNDRLSARNAIQHNDAALCKLQEREARAGILGVEIVLSGYGYSVRYDSGLQNFGLVASSRAGQLDGTLEHAVEFAKAWVDKDPDHRYAWMRKPN